MQPMLPCPMRTMTLQSECSFGLQWLVHRIIASQMVAPCRSPGMLLQTATTLLEIVMRQGPEFVYA